MNQKKTVQVAVIIVIGVWLACLSYFVSSKIAVNAQPETTTLPAPTTTQNTTVTTTAPATTLAATTLPSTTIVIGGNNVLTTVGQIEAPEWEQIQQSQQAQQQAESSFQALKDSIPQTKDEIITAYVKGVNALKKAENFTMHKDDKLNITADKLTGGSGAKYIFDLFVDKNQKEPVTYTFQNGIDDATSKTPMQVIAPLDKQVSLSAKDVKDARSAVVDSDGSYSIKISLNDEHQTYPNDAPAHSKMVEVVDVSLLITQSSGIMQGVQLKELDILYSGTTVEATFDKDGRIKSMTHYLPVTKAAGTMQYLALSVEMELHGDFTSVYTFTY